MRLSAIKLAGFKSFVDPTVLRLNGNLNGVVGPNGCGKSNVIDAVRWVLGESSARQLRGSALEDVIFNGASGRKPVGRAVIELVFDNSDGTLGGRYSSFGEISIKREIVRDGGSQYYLNGTRCRRRDVVDLFLGTGLGSRSSYAIIEQGTVSRIIEARPEELRLLIEEASGISKYREKRRETENRIRHTRENLERMADLRGELEQQIQRLQRQARDAEKYKEYKQEQRLLRVQRLALQYREIQHQARDQLQALEQAEARASDARDTLHALEAEAEQARHHQQQAAQAFQTEQGAFYGAEGEVARARQALEHARQVQQMQDRDRDALTREAQTLRQRLAEAREELNVRQRALEALAEQLEQAQAADAEHQTALDAAEELAAEAETDWEAFVAEADSPLRQEQAQRERTDGLEQRRQSLGNRLQRLQQEAQELDRTAAEESLASLNEELVALEQSIETADEAAVTHGEAVDTSRRERETLEQERHELREALQQSRGRLASLEALQAAALHTDGQALSEWLADEGAADAGLLAEQLAVEPGWERAVEAALGFFLRARCLPDGSIERLDPDEWPSGELVLVDSATAVEATTPAAAPRLLDKLRSAAPTPALSDVYTAEDWAEARALLDSLGASDRVVTRGGLVCGRGWLYRPSAEAATAGVLERERAVRAEQQAEAVAQARLTEVESTIAALDQALHDRRSAHAAAVKELQRLRQAHAQRLAERQAQGVRVEQLREREQRLQGDMTELKEQLDVVADEWDAAQQRLQALQTEAGRLADRRHRLQADLHTRRVQLRSARQLLDRHREHWQQLRVDHVARSGSVDAGRQACEQLEQRLDEVSSRLAEAERRSTDAGQPIEALEAEQQALAARHEAARTRLGEARQAQQAAEQAVQDVNERLRRAEQVLEQARDQVQQLRVDQQSQRVREDTLAEQVRDSGYDLETVLNGLPDAASAEEWQQRLERLERRIERLGAINLAAIQEFQEQSERLGYLEEQDNDLRTALETLEGAIRKIDRETRARFRETFDRIDGGLRELFPRLFGGGEAYLELTGDDLLETGVRVMARPPGKRNSSIQLLSGGEKALTAAALVFSLFELNPAPFCMLDEVDAPLDDANVSRFCELVRTMSERVQFILITHNKVTMELADQLHGVTMQEPGVSRLVSVDVQQALEMAEAS